jgi:ABC-type branched-subunit amino acid transport system substrate-binding protein
MKTWWQLFVHRGLKFPARLLRFALVLGCLGLLTLTGISDAQEECVPADGEPIIIGAIFPEGNLLTRRDGDAYQGAEAMRQAVNACGGVNGRPVRFLYEPANDRDDAAEAAHRLVEAGVPLIVGSGSQAVSEGAREVTESAGMIYWEMTESLDNAGEWSFSSRPDYETLGAVSVWFTVRGLAEALQIEPESLRIALVYEERPRGREVEQGVLTILELRDIEPIFEHTYSDILWETHNLAERIRDERIDVLIFSGFDEDGEYLWYDLREADANIKAWIQVGSQGYGREWCERGGNMQGFISIDATGPVNDNYRREAMGEVYTLYRRVYLNEYGTEPSYRADLSAAGMYMLLHYILPAIDGDITPTQFASGVLSIPYSEGQIGMMGEGTWVDSVGEINGSLGEVVRQQQGSFFCSVWPEEIATCAAGVQPFPTWRERALMEQNPAICEGDGI